MILLDRSGPQVRLLMGRRHRSHAFMPGKFVFPGGRTDPGDSRVATLAPLPAQDGCRLEAAARSAARARAIALSAVRETYEEAGLLIGKKAPFLARRGEWAGFADHGVAPSLEGLRYVARAITPPGRVRRYDTHFFATWRDSIAVELADGGPTHELEELVWLSLGEAMQADIPTITRSILGELESRLATDPQLDPGAPVPFFRMVRDRFVRDLL
jgi:8-oxo-dGTP pyrophosphatase MutT (NUDIX family)